MNWSEIIENKYLNYTFFIFIVILSCYFIIKQYNKQSIVSSIDENIVHISHSQDIIHTPKQLSPILLNTALFGNPTVAIQKKHKISHIIRLIGLVQTNNNTLKNSAIISVDTNTTKIFSPGDNIAPGIILSKIEEKHIIVNNYGTLITISLPKYI